MAELVPWPLTLQQSCEEKENYHVQPSPTIARQTVKIARWIRDFADVCVIKEKRGVVGDLSSSKSLRWPFGAERWYPRWLPARDVAWPQRHGSFRKEKSANGAVQPSPSCTDPPLGGQGRCWRHCWSRQAGGSRKPGVSGAGEGRAGELPCSAGLGHDHAHTKALQECQHRGASGS